MSTLYKSFTYLLIHLTSATWRPTEKISKLVSQLCRCWF